MKTAAVRLFAALSLLQDVAQPANDLGPREAAEFEAAKDAADEVLLTAATTGESSAWQALSVAGALRELVKVTRNTNTNVSRALSEAKEALDEFDRLALPLHAHFETEIQFAEEPFEAIGITSRGVEHYEATGDKGDLLGFLLVERPMANEIMRRLTRGAALDQQVECALRASKALIEALLSDDHRSEADLRDTLANFEGLAL